MTSSHVSVSWFVWFFFVWVFFLVPLPPGSDSFLSTVGHWKHDWISGSGLTENAGVVCRDIAGALQC